MDKLRRTLGPATSALGALLLIGALAFGSTVVRPMTASLFDHPASSAPAASGDLVGTDGFAPGSELAGAGQDGTAGSNVAACQDEQGNPVPCDGEFPPNEPPVETPAETPVEEPKDPPSDNPPSEPPASGDLTLGAGFNADLGKVVVEWSVYSGDFQKYKLVRSTDGEATWPLGPGDQLVDVVAAGGDRRYVDGDAPCNTAFYYRAFAVVHVGDGYNVLASSNVGTATRVCSDPTPVEPSAMGFGVVQAADGVHLTWDACGSDAFAAYKVVRSATNPNPMYPLNDGTELLVYFHDQGTTQFTDSNVEVGQTWTYRVLCMGHNGSGYYALGLTDAMTLTVQ
jgi:hypothetical protein